MATYSPSKITKDGNTYNFTDDTKIPLAGTNVLAGSIIPNTDNAYDLGSSSYGFRDVITYHITMMSNAIERATDDFYLSLRGSTSWNNGGAISVYGKNSSSNAGAFRLEAHNGTTDHYLVGRPDGALTWDGSPITYASDRRIKDEIESISDDVLNAWENLEPKQYKYKSDLENNKDTAQVHYGWIAQDVESIIKGDRKGEVKNSLWLHEEWEEQAEVSHEETYTEEVATKSGEKQTVTKTRKVIDTPYKAKGDSYGLRYTECLVVECAFLRKKLKELTARIEQLEKGNNVK